MAHGTVPRLKKITPASLFPSSPRQNDQTLKTSVLEVYIDRFCTLTYDQVVFIYRGLIRTAYRRALQLLFLSNGNRNGRKKKIVFSFRPFTPPWFTGIIDCKIKDESIYDPPLRFNEPVLPTNREFRSRSTPSIFKLQGPLDAFY